MKRPFFTSIIIIAAICGCSRQPAVPPTPNPVRNANNLQLVNGVYDHMWFVWDDGKTLKRVHVSQDSVTNPGPGRVVAFGNEIHLRLLNKGDEPVPAWQAQVLVVSGLSRDFRSTEPGTRDVFHCNTDTFYCGNPAPGTTMGRVEGRACPGPGKPLVFNQDADANGHLVIRLESDRRKADGNRYAPYGPQTTFDPVFVLVKVNRGPNQPAVTYSVGWYSPFVYMGCNGIKGCQQFSTGSGDLYEYWYQKWLQQQQEEQQQPAPAPAPPAGSIYLPSSAPGPDISLDGVPWVGFACEYTPDSDNDGWNDAVDGCPANPDLQAETLCGCELVIDTDNDGVPDCLDACPCNPWSRYAPCTSWGDGDADGDLDQEDFGSLQACITDPANPYDPYEPACQKWDLDHDGDIGVLELDTLSSCASGPAVPATACTRAIVDYGYIGCPGLPNPEYPGPDGDGIITAADNCPTRYNTDQLDSDLDGAGDACDACPNDALKTQPGFCGCGVPDSDADGDGWADCVDGCPNDPLKVAPGACGCGAADTDTDGDGTADCVDGCPDDPLKTDPGFCGCDFADADADGDGVLDCVDFCPETPVGTPVDEWGCPLGEGGMSLMSALDSQATTALEPPVIPVSASFVQHDTGETAVSLSKRGGTVVVDLVLNGNPAVMGFQAQIATNAAGVISIDATGWTETANVLYSLGGGGALPSYYDMRLLDWYAAYPTRAAALEGQPGADVVAGTSLSQITGPQAGEVMTLEDSLAAIQGPIHSTAGPIGGYFKTVAPAEPCVVLTLTLRVSGTPGTYTLGLTEGTWGRATDGATLGLAAGETFTVTVRGH